MNGERDFEVKRQAQEIGRIRAQKLAELISNALVLFGATGSFVLVLQQDENHQAIITHAVSKEALPEIMRRAYEPVSGGIILPNRGGSN